MAEGGNVNQGEGSCIVKQELFPEEGSSVDVRKKELSLLIKITKENGESLPNGTVNDQLIIELFENNVGTLPVSILVLNDQDALVNFAPGTMIFRWFKFTLKPPYSIAHDKLRLAIWDTSCWTFWLKFGHKGP